MKRILVSIVLAPLALLYLVVGVARFVCGHPRVPLALLRAWAALFLTALWCPARGGEVSVSWGLPTNNMDGTPLTDLAGCKVYFGPASRTYTGVQDVPGHATWPCPATDGCCPTSAVVTGLTDCARYFLTGTAYNRLGMESDFSDEIERVSSDQTPPALTCPVAWAIPSTNGVARVPDLRPLCTATDACSASAVTLTQSPAPGMQVPVGVHPVVVRARDASGNEAEAVCALSVLAPTRPGPLQFLVGVP